MTTMPWPALNGPTGLAPPPVVSPTRVARFYVWKS
jgi:hypothetical protein